MAQNSTVDPDTMGRAIANSVGGTGDSWRAFSAQIQAEGWFSSSRSQKNNNPLNLRPISGGWPGQVGTDNAPGGPFAVFDSVNSGIQAASTNYMAANYKGVVSAAQSGSAPATASAIESSPWSAGGYGGLVSAIVGSFPSVSTPSLPSPPASSSSAMPVAGPPTPTLAQRFSGSGLFSAPIVGGLVQIGAKSVVTVGVIGLIFVGMVKIAGGSPSGVAKRVATVAK